MAPLLNNYYVSTYEPPKIFLKRLLFFLPLAALVCGVMIHWAFYVLAAVLLIVLVLVVIKKDRCPHCGKLIWGKPGEYCPHCDERLDAKCEE